MMLYYILMAVAVMLALAKRKGRKFRKYLKGTLDETMDLATLGAKVVVSQSSTGVLEEKAWLSSIKATWSMDDFTPATDDGPITVGVAHHSYSSAEIEEWVENDTGSWKEGSIVQQEVARRRIRQVGTFETSRGASAAGISVLNDGKPIRTKCGWQLQTSDGLRIWAYNQGASALATTAPNVLVQGHANLWPN